MDGPAAWLGEKLGEARMQAIGETLQAVAGEVATVKATVTEVVKAARASSPFRGRRAVSPARARPASE